MQKLERALTEHTEAIRDDLNARMLAGEGEVRGMRSPIEHMSSDLGGPERGR